MDPGPKPRCNLWVISQAHPQRSQRFYWADFAGAVPSTPHLGHSPGTTISKGSCTKATGPCMSMFPERTSLFGGLSTWGLPQVLLLRSPCWEEERLSKTLCSDSVPSALKFLALPPLPPASPGSKNIWEPFVWGCLSSEMTWCLLWSARPQLVPTYVQDGMWALGPHLAQSPAPPSW